MPRGVAALGYAQYMPKEQFLYTKEQLLDQMSMALGGRAAEDIVFGKISTGAQNDLERITKLAYAMVTIYGMNEKVGNVSFYDAQQEYNFHKPYSEETSKIIDQEVRLLIDSSYQRTKAMLNDKRDKLEALAHALLEKEILFQQDLEALIGKRPYESKNIHEPMIETATEEEIVVASENGTTSENGIEKHQEKQPVVIEENKEV